MRATASWALRRGALSARRVGRRFLSPPARRAEVTSEGTLPAASNVPLDELPALLEEWVTSPPFDLVFVCAEGQRSLVAARAARRLGIDCASLEGGLGAWRDRGLPLDPVGATHRASPPRDGPPSPVADE